MDEKTINDVLAVRRKFLHGIGHRMEGLIFNGSVEFHFNHLGKYAGVNTVKEKGERNKEN